jgi:ATP-dependent protease ClpP protease subunit
MGTKDKKDRSMADGEPEMEGPVEIAFAGDLTDQGADLMDKLLGVPQQGECTLYFDSPGGSPYAAVSLMSLIVLRDLHATGIVCGECSSAAIWPLAACRRRIVTPYSVLLFHPMKWQSEEHVHLPEAAEWARHFAHLEKQMDELLASTLNVTQELLQSWMRPGRYVTGPEFAEAGLAELVDIVALAAKSGSRERSKILPRKGGK